jgi:hypothetical protein
LTSDVQALVKSGDRLFGGASVLCAECARGRTFVVYIVWGQGGWFSEIKHEREGIVFVPKKIQKDGIQAYFKALEALVPKKARIPIGEFSF